jgi:uracil-DNA glycosylase family 4
LQNDGQQDYPLPDALELLRWYVENGVDVALGETAVNHFTQPQEKPAAGATAPGQTPASAPAGRTLPERRPITASAPAVLANAAVPGEEAVSGARELAAAAATLDELREAMARFEGCNLRLTAKNLVFADGNPQARVMLVGEAPVRDEDEQGVPLVGRSGQLLDKMLAAIGLDRTKVYITNAIAWRPPGDRAPTPQETHICQPFIERHIELAKPEILVLMGGPSVKMLIDRAANITHVRGRWTTVKIGERDIETLPMLHPTYLLRYPAQKGLAWQDLLKLKARLEQGSG